MVNLVGQPNAAAYATSKGGQIAMAKNMAIDLPLTASALMSFAPAAPRPANAANAYIRTFEQYIGLSPSRFRSL